MKQQKSQAVRELFLPTSRADMQARGWDSYDFLCITGDAYVDHPSFGFAIITRVLEHAGFRIAVLAQPAKSPSISTRQRTMDRVFFILGSS